MRIFTLFALMILTACGTGTVIQDRVQTVSVPVTVPCVSGERPAPVESLESKHPDLYEKSLKQKAELAAAQAGRHKNYGQELNAATLACK